MLVIILASVFSLKAVAGYSVGFIKVDTFSNETNEEIPVAVTYPTNVPEKAVRFGPFEMNLAIGAEVAKGTFPLVIISHGSGGSNLGHRSIAFALAKQGFVVAMPLHPENNYKNNSAEGTVKNWKNRPKHIKTAIDALLLNPKLSPNINIDKIAVIGHSAGGYTALAVAGGMAQTNSIIELCNKKLLLKERMCGLVKDHKLTPAQIENRRDQRVKAIVLMAPVGVLFTQKDSLEQVNIPVLVMRAENDAELTEPYQSEMIAQNMKDKEMLTYRVIKNAGHYSFITPFPDAIKSEAGVAGEDPVGFDRKAFHKRLSAEIVTYLLRVLK